MTSPNDLHPLSTPAPTHDPAPAAMGPPTGLGPVILPPEPVAPPAPSGARGLVRRLVERATRFETDRQRAADTQRDFAVARELGETRIAVQAFIDAQTPETARLNHDVTSFAEAVTGVVRHVEALQQSHNRVVDEQRAADTALADRLTTEVADLRADLARIERRIAELTHVMEQWKS